jgi:hypothetical protein
MHLAPLQGKPDWALLGMLCPMLSLNTTCVSHHEDTCVSYEEEDTCVSPPALVVLGTWVRVPRLGYMGTWVRVHGYMG